MLVMANTYSSLVHHLCTIVKGGPLAELIVVGFVVVSPLSVFASGSSSVNDTDSHVSTLCMLQSSSGHHPVKIGSHRHEAAGRARSHVDVDLDRLEQDVAGGIRRIREPLMDWLTIVMGCDEPSAIRVVAHMCSCCIVIPVKEHRERRVSDVLRYLTQRTMVHGTALKQVLFSRLARVPSGDRVRRWCRYHLMSSTASSRTGSIARA